MYNPKYRRKILFRSGVNEEPPTSKTLVGGFSFRELYRSIRELKHGVFRELTVSRRELQHKVLRYCNFSTTRCLSNAIHAPWRDSRRWAIHGASRFTF